MNDKHNFCIIYSASVFSIFLPSSGPPGSSSWGLQFAKSPKMSQPLPFRSNQTTRLPRPPFKHSRSSRRRRRCDGGTRSSFCPSDDSSRRGEMSLAAWVKREQDSETDAEACGDSKVCSSDCTAFREMCLGSGQESDQMIIAPERLVSSAFSTRIKRKEHCV